MLQKPPATIATSPCLPATAEVIKPYVGARKLLAPTKAAVTVQLAQKWKFTLSSVAYQTNTLLYDNGSWKEETKKRERRKTATCFLTIN